MAELKDIDLEIVKRLYNLKVNQTITTYSLAKKLFDGSGAKNKLRFFTDKAKYIDYRMEKISKAGIIDISKTNGKKIYTLILNNVRRRHKRIMIEEFKLKVNGEWESFVRKF